MCSKECQFVGALHVVPFLDTTQTYCWGPMISYWIIKSLSFLLTVFMNVNMCICICICIYIYICICIYIYRTSIHMYTWYCIKYAKWYFISYTSRFSRFFEGQAPRSQVGGSANPSSAAPPGPTLADLRGLKNHGKTWGNPLETEGFCCEIICSKMVVLEYGWDMLVWDM